jgi:hypothetical protein
MTNYKAKASKSQYKGQTNFYPIVEFYTKATGTENFYLNEPQPTRSKAVTIAKRYINNIKN